MWVLRFFQPDIDEPPMIRILILSRNITYDRSWDISVQLEGRPGRRYIATNRPLGEFLSSLPSISTQPVEKARRVQLDQLAEEVRKAVWELPEGFEAVSFHLIGKNRKPWAPSLSRRMAIISPFITDDALTWLGDQTEELVAVISRPDELNQIGPETLQLAKKWFTLDEAAETEDGEEPGKQDNLQRDGNEGPPSASQVKIAGYCCRLL
jgi:hypothetical protein